MHSIIHIRLMSSKEEIHLDPQESSV